MAKILSHPGHEYKLDCCGNRLYEGQPLGEDEYVACPYCKEEASGGDIYTCVHCEVIIENEVIIYTWWEWDEPGREWAEKMRNGQITTIYES